MAEGDIGTKIGELRFDAAKGEDSNIILVSGSVYAIAHRGDASDGYVTCVNIPTTGNPTLISGGALEFDADYCYDPHIIKITDNVYAVVYRGTDLDGFIKTIAITDAGIPSLIGGGALEFYITNCENPHIIHVSGTVYAISFKGAVDRGQILTINITGAGIPTLIGGGDLEYHNAATEYPRIIHVSGTVYATVFRTIGAVGKLKTINITDAGIPTLIGGGVLDFESTDCWWPNIIHVTGEVFAIVYKGDAGDGYLTTVNITSAGVPTLIGGGVLEFDSVDGDFPDIAHVSGTVYAIVYRGPSAHCWMKTVTISADGATVALQGSSKDIDALGGNHPDIIHISGNVYAIPYTGNGDEGWLKTYPIETVLLGYVKHLMMIGVG